MQKIDAMIFLFWHFWSPWGILFWLTLTKSVRHSVSEFCRLYFGSAPFFQLSFKNQLNAPQLTYKLPQFEHHKSATIFIPACIDACNGKLGHVQIWFYKNWRLCYQSKLFTIFTALLPAFTNEFCLTLIILWTKYD